MCHIWSRPICCLCSISRTPSAGDRKQYDSRHDRVEAAACRGGAVRSGRGSRGPPAGALEAAGSAVQTTGEPVCCGLTWISTGQLDGARRQLRRTLRALGPALDDGVPVVGLDPWATAVLRGEIPELLPDDPRASRTKAATRTLAELLTATGDWEPPDLGGVHAVAQPHWHHHAGVGWHADSPLLARSGAEVTAVGGCCGLAGNFGVERGHYDVSQAVAETALLPAVRAARTGHGDAVVLADGFSCRTQLDQLARVGSVHLAQLLAGRLPDP